MKKGEKRMKANNPNAPLERDADEAARAGLSNSKTTAEQGRWQRYGEREDSENE